MISFFRRYRCLSKNLNYFTRCFASDIPKDGNIISPTDSSAEKAPKHETPLEKEIKTKMLVNGPYTMARYMAECLTHPIYGFYNKKNAIGREGHFVTSPELTPVFGELIGLWCYMQWEKLGKPSEVCLAEIGPGKGTLMKNLLSAARVFPDFYESLSCHLVESSQHMIKKQQYTLNCILPPGKDHKPNEISYEMKLPNHGPSIYWHNNYEELPHLPMIIIGHEFLDALPIHQFEYHQNQWLERFVDIDPKTKELYVRLSQSITPAGDILLYPQGQGKIKINNSTTTSNFDINNNINNNNRIIPNLSNLQSLSPSKIFNPQYDEKQINNKPIKEGLIIEASPDVCAFMQKVALTLDRESGSALFIDYGHNHINYQTIRGIYHHKFVDILTEPGNVDLSGDIDWSSITRAMNILPLENVKTYGPIPQGYFLCGMGIEERVKILLSQMRNEKDQENLMKASQRLVLKEHMGQIYKCYCMSTTGLPAAFEGGEQFWIDFSQ